jgi:hypothetical protein
MINGGKKNKDALKALNRITDVERGVADEVQSRNQMFVKQ